MTINISAQRVTDKLDRGLVAVKVTGGVYLSWRILGEEYYDVAYNVYRDGVKVNETPLKVSNYTDLTGTTDNKYSVSYPWTPFTRRPSPWSRCSILLNAP